ncbi:hypothetical protein [uncultured Marivirga sp.]|uniref:hypothetical protein n=1 Tax=uncultured Marivirga sp. TaxID=1123707 RepID=UPI0030EB2AA1|tara:strand:- start:104268 stop:105320 length:1053 start_codon:yes stop_codon:yes gene_type:complete
MIIFRYVLIFALVTFSSCKITESKSSVESIKINTVDLVSFEDAKKIKDEIFMQSNFFIKEILIGDVLYLKANDLNHVDAYHLQDSSRTKYQFSERPIKINEFSVGSDRVFLLSSQSKLLLVFDKEGKFIKEIPLKIGRYEIEGDMGESLFQWNEGQQIFYLGLTKSKRYKGVELVGIFDLSGQLKSTFGDFTKDNDQAIPGFILANHGIRHQLTKNAFYILKKESSQLYQFDFQGSLKQKVKLDFKVIPNKEKVLVAGKQVIKDQVMDFYVDEHSKELVFTYFTNTGSYFGERKPDPYLAYKKFKSDTIYYDKVDFFNLLDYQDHVISTIPFNPDSEAKYLTSYGLDLRN